MWRLCLCTLATTVEFSIFSGGCKKYFCTRCMKINRNEYKVLCEGENVHWMCDICKEMLRMIFNNLVAIKEELLSQKSRVNIEANCG